MYALSVRACVSERENEKQRITICANQMNGVP